MIFSLPAKRVFATLGFLTIFFPFLALAQPGTVNTPGTGITYDCAKENPGVREGECTFADLLKAITKITNWGTGFALAFSVIVIAWAGFNYMISGDNASKRSAANKMLRQVVTGIAFILLAWLIVTAITSALGVNVSFLR